MIVSGTPQKAATFADTALLDSVVDSDVVAAAVALAQQVVADKRPLRRLRDVKLPTAGADAFLQFARNSVKAAAKGMPAPLACMEAVADSVTQIRAAGSNMTQIVNGVRGVASNMSLISAASAEQSDGVGQVGEAVMQMDQATQQNAALVEEMAAAASSLRTQAQQMVEAIARFNLGGGEGRH